MFKSVVLRFVRWNFIVSSAQSDNHIVENVIAFARFRAVAFLTWQKQLPAGAHLCSAKLQEKVIVNCMSLLTKAT